MGARSAPLSRSAKHHPQVGLTILAALGSSAAQLPPREAYASFVPWKPASDAPTHQLMVRRHSVPALSPKADRAQFDRNHQMLQRRWAARGPPRTCRRPSSPARGSPPRYAAPLPPAARAPDLIAPRPRPQQRRWAARGPPRTCRRPSSPARAAPLGRPRPAPHLPPTQLACAGSPPRSAAPLPPAARAPI
eukprot:tig00021070_g17838.t1